MTNEELLSAIRAIIREELKARAAIEPGDVIVEGPDEDGRVKFAGTKTANKNVWVLSVLTVRQAAEGRIPELTEKQLATLMMNVGCDRYGTLEPAAGRGYGQTGNKAVDQMTPFTNKVIKQATFWQPNRWVFGPAFRQDDGERTIASRSEDIEVLVKSVENLGTLRVNDGSSFRPA